MAKTLVERLAERLAGYEPEAPELQEVACSFCGGVGQWFMTSLFPTCDCGSKGFHLHRCFYCSGTGLETGASKP